MCSIHGLPILILKGLLYAVSRHRERKVENSMQSNIHTSSTMPQCQFKLVHARCLAKNGLIFSATSTT